MPRADNNLTMSRRNAKPIPKFGRGLSRERRQRGVLSMADDPVFRNATYRDDSDCEEHTWPDFINQSRIGEAARGYWANDDMELDDGV